tara:strand:- start:790 stop:1443 length:654 start_codon:yes stop_codon:yes gene_type:complete
MVSIRSQKQLSVVLSRLKGFETSKVSLEQYSTDSNIAAFLLWNAALIDFIDDKTVLDLGCGTGILGLGALFIDAEKVFFVDKDKDALNVLKENIKFIDEELMKIPKKKYKIINKDVEKLNKKDVNKVKIDIVIMNPPFGVQNEHADKEFLKVGFSTRKPVYSIHKVESRKFLEKFSADNGYKLTHFWEMDFPLKKTMKFHRKPVKKIRVCVCRFDSV